MTQEILQDHHDEISFQEFVESEIKKKAFVNLPVAIETEGIVELISEAIANNKADPEKKALMVEKGFSVRRQLESGVIRLVKEVNDGSSFDEAREGFIRTVGQDLSAFIFEFLKQEPVLINPLSFIETQYGRKVVGGDYNEIPIEETTSMSDREGSTKEAIELLAANLPYIKANSMLIVTSPRGWSGLTGLKYPETQIYIYLVNSENKLEALTVRNKMSLDECEEFVRTLTNGSFEPVGSSERERVKHVLRSLVFVETEDQDGFEKATLIMEKVSGKVAFDDGDRQITYSEVREKIKDRNKLACLEENAKQVVQNLQKYLRENFVNLDKATLADLAVAMGKAVLNLTAIIRTRKQNPHVVTDIGGMPEGRMDYSRLATELEEQQGCEPESTKLIRTPIGNRKYEKTAPSFVKKCPFCGKHYGKVLEPGHKCDCGQIFLGIC